MNMYAISCSKAFSFLCSHKAILKLHVKSILTFLLKAGKYPKENNYTYTYPGPMDKANYFFISSKYRFLPPSTLLSKSIAENRHKQRQLYSISNCGLIVLFLAL